MSAGFGEGSIFDPAPSPFTDAERERARPTAPVEDAPLPAFDPATGEVLDGPQDAAPAPTVQDAPVRPLEDRTGADSVVLDLGPHDDVTTFTRDLRSAVIGRIDSGYSALLAVRPDDQPIEVAVRDEVRWLAATVDTLSAVGRVFTDAARYAKSIAGDVVQEARPDRDLVKHGGTASLRMPVRPQAEQDVKVTVTRATEPYADLDAILDVVVAHLIDAAAETNLSGAEVDAYAVGARDALAAAREVTSPWKVKTSSLDVLARRLPEPLADRLTAAYGRRPVDREPMVTFETVEP